MVQASLLSLLIACVSAQSASYFIKKNEKPNIVLIVADDLGWDDVSFHGSPQIPTPNIDTLALSGVILNNYYVSPNAFATKSELMTGKYASHLGLQHGVIHNKQPVGLPEEEHILPQYLKELGYRTHAVGKWSLGFYKDELLPWNRGFDSFYGGVTSGGADYYTHSAYDENYGLDLRCNEKAVHNETGHYVTDLYTSEAVKVIDKHDKTKPLFLYVAHQAVHSGNADDPLQAPPEHLSKVSHIRNVKRRMYGGMVAALDESVQNITTALSTKGLLENTVIIFTTSCGGAVGGMELNSGSNYPLRGSKMTLWEGGIRGVAFVYSELISENSRVNEEMFHSTDWFPTILGLAGGNWKSINSLDGFNIWDAISRENFMSPRFEILHQFDSLQKNQCALRVGDYKLIINQDIGFYGDWFPRPAEVGELQQLTKPSTLPNAKLTCDKNYPHPFLEMHAPPCDPMRQPCLFNIQWDPCEFHNLANFMPNTLKVLLDRLHYYRTGIVKPMYPKFDIKADPDYQEGVWGPWINRTRSTQLSIPSLDKPSALSLNNEVLNTTSPFTSPNQPRISVGFKPQETNTFLMGSSNSSFEHPTIIKSSVITENKNKVPNMENVSSGGLGPKYSSPNSLYPPYGSNGSSFSTQYPSNIPEIGTVEKNGVENLDVISDSADHVIMSVKNRNATKEQEHQFSNLVGDIAENGNVETKMDMKGKTTHVDVLQNETSNEPVETTSTIDQLQLDKKRNISTAAVSENGLAYANTNTESHQNVESMVFDSGPVNLKVKGEENYQGNADSSHLISNMGRNETTGEGPSSLATALSPSTDQKIAPSTVDQPAPRPVPVAIGDHKEGEVVSPKPEGFQKPISQSGGLAEANNLPAKPDNSYVSPYELKEPIEPVEPAKPLAPAIPSHPEGVSLRPEKDKQKVSEAAATGVNASSIKLASGSDTAVSTESSANTLTEAKTDSKLPALQNPHVIASLNNLADAGKPGKSGMSSEVALVTGENIGPATGGKPVAANFVKEPKYEAVEMPSFDKPVNPFAKQEKMSTGTSSSAGSETETETSVGANGNSASDTKIKHKLKESKELTSPTSAEAKEVEQQKVVAPSALQLPVSSETSKLTASGLPTPEADSKELPVVKVLNQTNLHPAVAPDKVSNQSIEEEMLLKNLSSSNTLNETSSLSELPKEILKAYAAMKTKNETSSVNTSPDEITSAKDLNKAIAVDTLPKVLASGKAVNQTYSVEALPKELAAEKAVNQSIGSYISPKSTSDSLLKSSKQNLGSSLKAQSNNRSLEKGVEFSLALGQHNDLPNIAIADHRTFQSVVDLVSDSSNQVCANGRSCISHPADNSDRKSLGTSTKDETAASSINRKPVEALEPTANDSTAFITTNPYEPIDRFKPFNQGILEPGTQATSNQLLATRLNAKNLTSMKMLRENDILDYLPAQEKLHKFFGEIKMDNKKLFYISGTASEDKDMVYPQVESSKSTQNDVKKHNIGFNVVLPSKEIKQVAPAAKLKEHNREEVNKTHKDHVSQRKEGHPKAKSEIKKVFDMISNPARMRKMKVPETPENSNKVLISKSDIATETDDTDNGDTGDIGATKPLQDTDSKSAADLSLNVTNSTDSNVGELGKKSKAPASTEAGDLGSIVTLVGKVKVDRLSTKRSKHNSSREKERKDKNLNEHIVNRMKHNGTETNAANIDKIAGPSNSIIVSSVIVVLIASFVVVGMAVVAVVAVVARHCHLGKHMDAT